MDLLTLICWKVKHLHSSYFSHLSLLDECSSISKFAMQWRICFPYYQSDQISQGRMRLKSARNCNFTHFRVPIGGLTAQIWDWQFCPVTKLHFYYIFDTCGAAKKTQLLQSAKQICMSQQERGNHEVAIAFGLHHYGLKKQGGCDVRKSTTCSTQVWKMCKRSGFIEKSFRICLALCNNCVLQLHISRKRNKSEVQ